MLKIVADSTCDLSQELIEKYNIQIAPLHIVLGEKEFKDGEETFFKRYDLKDVKVIKRARKEETAENEGETFAGENVTGEVTKTQGFFQEEAAKRIYEECLEAEGFAFDVKYNAKGNLYNLY